MLENVRNNNTIVVIISYKFRWHRCYKCTVKENNIMWNKPNFETNTYELGNFNELTEAQMLAADGEAGAGCVGTCVGIGYVCWKRVALRVSVLASSLELG